MSENQEFRIEKLEVDREETERELDNLNNALMRAEHLKSELIGTAKEQTELFIQGLQQQRDNNEDILNEIDTSIEWIRRG